MTGVSRLASLARYCRPGTIEGGIPTDGAFWVRPAEEYLSVNILPEDLGVEAGLAQVKKILDKKRFGANTNGRFAVFNTGTITQHMREYGMDVKIEHRPSSYDPTHAGISPAGRYDEDAWHISTRIMARALSQFFKDNPGSVYPVR